MLRRRRGQRFDCGARAGQRAAGAAGGSELVRETSDGVAPDDGVRVLVGLEALPNRRARPGLLALTPLKPKHKI